jgi:hypothetical protein
LKASGRLEGIRSGDYIFAPLKYPGKAEGHDRAEAWAKDRYVSTSQLLSSLKMYGKAAGIEEEKLTLQTLRRTATRLKLDEGSSLEEVQGFLGSEEEKRFTKFRLHHLPQLPEDEGGEREIGEPPNRSAKPFKPGEGVKHGMYARSQPLEQVQAVMRENISGVDEEIESLRELERGLLALFTEAATPQQSAQLSNAYTLTAARLGSMIESEMRLSEPDEPKEGAMEWLERMDEVLIREGNEPVSENIIKMWQETSLLPEVSARRLDEEIASTRLVLRNAGVGEAVIRERRCA